MTAPALWESAAAEAATGGRSSRAWRAGGISIDSRTLEPGDLFVALRGPNFDGRDFVDAAFRAGAAAAMVPAPAPAAAAGPLLAVDDPLEGLRGLARASRARTGARIAAVTGSVGKTGVKEGLAHALAAQGATSASERSFNNHWGVPLSLARMPERTAFGVLEIGMNRAGEIRPLAALARPRAATVTAVAPAHMAFFDGIEDVARAKAEIFSGLAGGTAVLNADSPGSAILEAAARDAGCGETVRFGSRADADMRLLACGPDRGGLRVSALWRGEALDFLVAHPARHWAHNALALLATVHGLGADVRAAADALASLPALGGRGRVHRVEWEEGTLTLVDDSYNANPASMRAALETLAAMDAGQGRRVAVLGDMLELGSFSRGAHEDLKAGIEGCGIDRVHLVGREMRALAGVLDAERLGLAADSAGEILPGVIGDLRAGDVVTVKASNGIGLARVVAAILERGGGGEDGDAV